MSKSTRATTSTVPGFFADSAPHYVRRLHQQSVALFHEETGRLALTPLQYVMLVTVLDQPGLNQRMVGRLVGMDFATVSGVLQRLEDRGLIVRSSSPDDRRIRIVQPTARGKRMLATLQGVRDRTRARLIAPLSPTEQKTFLKLLRKVYEGNVALGMADDTKLS